MAQSVKDAVKFVEQGRILSVRADLVSHIDPSLQCRLCINCCLSTVKLET